MTKQEKVASKKLNLHQKLVEIRKEIPFLQKGATGFKFKYAEGSILLGLLRPKMDELGVLLSYDIIDIETDNVEREVKGKVCKIGRTRLKYVFTFTDAENPADSISKTICTQGIGDDIQSCGGYNTYTMRYFLLGFFNIPTDEKDPDTFDNTVKASKSVEVDEKKEARTVISDVQVMIIEALINGHQDIHARMVTQYKKLNNILMTDYNKVINTINKLISDKEAKQ